MEFFGEGADSLSIGDRATISNMCPEYGATAAMFSIDDQTLAYLRLTGRDEAQVRLVEAYARTAGFWSDSLADAQYERVLQFDLSTVVRNMAGPSNPHRRLPTSALAERGIADAAKLQAARAQERQGLMPDGAVIIAAITSCTNTSNPRNVIAAALLARNANRLGLTRKPWVKSSLAPGSKAVELYLKEAGLLTELQQLGFGIVAFACTTCNGMSGALDPRIQQEIVERDLYATAVLSGNRNFDGRIHPYAKQAFLASPPLVVAYALAGTIRFDIEQDVLGVVDGREIRLRTCGPPTRRSTPSLPRPCAPSNSAPFTNPCSPSARTMETKPRPSTTGAPVHLHPPPALLGYRRRGRAGGLPAHAAQHAAAGAAARQHHHRPPVALQRHPGRQRGGRIPGAHGPAREDFNSYATHRGDHLTAMRATFANPQLVNEMAVIDGVQHKGSLARIEPEGRVVRMWEAMETYLNRRQPLIIIAGADYGQGSSRDWAAKGVRLAGVEAVVAEGFERIHRTNLIGMGVLPLQFLPGTDRKTLALDGTEVYGVEGERTPGTQLTLVVERRNGQTLRVPVTCRLDTAEEVSVYEAGGVLQRFAQDFLAQAQAA